MSGLSRCQSSFPPQLSASPPAHSPCLLGLFPCLHRALCPGLLHPHNLCPLLSSLSPSPPPGSCSSLSLPGEGCAGLCSQGQSFLPRDQGSRVLDPGWQAGLGLAQGPPLVHWSPQHLPFPFSPAHPCPTFLPALASWGGCGSACLGLRGASLSPPPLQWCGGAVNLGVVGCAGLQVASSLTTAGLQGAKGGQHGGQVAGTAGVALSAPREAALSPWGQTHSPRMLEHPAPHPRVPVQSRSQAGAAGPAGDIQGAPCPGRRAARTFQCLTLQSRQSPVGEQSQGEGLSAWSPGQHSKQ